MIGDRDDMIGSKVRMKDRPDGAVTGARCVEPCCWSLSVVIVLNLIVACCSVDDGIFACASSPALQLENIKPCLAAFSAMWVEWMAPRR